MNPLSAGPALEPARHPVGRRSTILVDHARADRALGVDLWYPAANGTGPMSSYELFPGVSFEAAGARHQPPAASGRFPLVLFSHGRTGMRFAYSLLCEALAARGAVVVSSDHPGDALADWLLGQYVDDRTNEVNRVGDAHFLLDALLHGHDAVPADVLAAVDHDHIALAGHSYGAYTAFATAAGVRGVAAHERVGAVIGYQSYTRTMSDGAIGRLEVPALLVVGELDRVAPAATDADRPWALLRCRPRWRLDIAGAGHQAVSDMGLYAELADRVLGLPDVARQYLRSAAADAVGPGLRPWRDLLRLQVRATWAFLEVTLGLDVADGLDEADAIADEAGVQLRRH